MKQTKAHGSDTKVFFLNPEKSKADSSRFMHSDTKTPKICFEMNNWQMNILHSLLTKLPLSFVLLLISALRAQMWSQSLKQQQIGLDKILVAWWEAQEAAAIIWKPSRQTMKLPPPYTHTPPALLPPSAQSSTFSFALMRHSTWLEEEKERKKLDTMWSITQH